MIKYLGHSMFLIDNKILIDPHDGGSIGLPKPAISQVDLVLITHDHYDHNAYEILTYKDLKIRLYSYLDFEGYKITGYRAYHDKEKGKKRGETAIYRIEKPDSKVIVHLGDLGDNLSESLLKEIATPDVLMIPVGGLITIDYKEASNLVRDIKPSVIFPMHYWIKGSLMPLDPIDNFIQEMESTKWKIKEYKNEINENEEKDVIFFIT